MPWKECDLMDVRTEFVTRAMGKGVDFGRLCREYGISRKTGYKWQKRFLGGGLSALGDRSRRPQRSPAGLAEGVVCEMVRLKYSHRHWGAAKIRDLYLRKHCAAPSVSSFKRILDKAGLVMHRRRRPVSSHEPLRTGIQPREPNDLWTVDFKGWWYTAGRQRCEPLTVRDACCRFILAITAVPSSRTSEIRKQFERLFERYGLPKAIRSDNGSPFASTRSPLGLSALSAWWVALGITLDRTRPAHPEDNGSHERMHRDIRAELQGLIEGDISNHQHAFDVWREEYNWERPHEALGMKRPGEVYHKSSIPWQGTPDELAYDTSLFSRKISSAGQLVVNRTSIFISKALTGWNVGLRFIAEQRLELWFAHLRLGEVDLTTNAFVEASQPTKSEAA